MADSKKIGIGSAERPDGLTLSPLVRQLLEYEEAVTIFKSQDAAQSLEEFEAQIANGSILLARLEIQKLKEKIEAWERVIVTSNRSIQKYRRMQNAEAATKPGRPTRENAREQVAKKYIRLWVASLIEALGAKGCGSKRGLEKYISSTPERNWRRWLNGDSVPSSASFDSLLSSKIAYGKYAGEMLLNVPINPSHDQVATLLRFL